MADDPRASTLLDVVIGKACGAATRETVTIVRQAGPQPALYSRCDLLSGDVTALFHDELAGRGEALLSLHREFVDMGDEAIAACFASFVQLADVIDGREPAGE